MATIGPVELSIKMRADEAHVDVKYDITFDSYDQHSNQAYAEVCKLVGDDTGTGDSPAAGADDTLGFLTPLFFRSTRSDGSATLGRHFTKTFRKAELDEDRGPIPNPDEIRAVVTLTPVLPSAATRESNLVKKKI
jgi:hypothetical protein